VEGIDPTISAKNKLYCLQEMQRLCHDNGEKFTEADKLDRIRYLLETKSAKISYQELQGKLVRLYSKGPLHSIPRNNVLVLSTHVDFVKNIKHPFVELSATDNVLHGTFDNSATNAAALYLMLSGALPDNVIVAFTGNEESGMRGAAELDEFLTSQLEVSPFYLVLDVTDIGFKKKQFSIENTFSMPTDLKNDLIKIAQEVKYQGYLYPKALPDEAYAYAQRGARSCSLCVPTDGPMHSDKGCDMELSAYLSYVDVLEHIANTFKPPTPNLNRGLKGCAM